VLPCCVQFSDQKSVRWSQDKTTYITYLDCIEGYAFWFVLKCFAISYASKSHRFVLKDECSIFIEGLQLFSVTRRHVCNPYTRKRLQFSLPEELSICIVRTVSNSHSRKCFRCVLTDYFSIRIDRSFRFVSFDLYWRKVFDPYPNPKSFRLLSFEDLTVLILQKKNFFSFRRVRLFLGRIFESPSICRRVYDCIIQSEDNTSSPKSLVLGRCHFA